MSKTNQLKSLMDRLDHFYINKTIDFYFAASSKLSNKVFLLLYFFFFSMGVLNIVSYERKCSTYPRKHGAYIDLICHTLPNNHILSLSLIPIFALVEALLLSTIVNGFNGKYTYLNKTKKKVIKYSFYFALWVFPIPILSNMFFLKLVNLINFLFQLF